MQCWSHHCCFKRTLAGCDNQTTSKENVKLCHAVLHAGTWAPSSEDLRSFVPFVSLKRLLEQLKVAMVGQIILSAEVHL